MLSDCFTNFNEDHVDDALRIGNLPDSKLIAARLGSAKRFSCASPDDPGHTLRVSPRVWRFGAGQSEIAVAIKPRLAVTRRRPLLTQQ